MWLGSRITCPLSFRVTEEEPVVFGLTGTYTRLPKKVAREWVYQQEGISLWQVFKLGTVWCVGRVTTRTEVVLASVGDATTRLPWEVEWPGGLVVTC